MKRQGTAIISKRRKEQNFKQDQTQSLQAKSLAVMAKIGLAKRSRSSTMRAAGPVATWSAPRGSGVALSIGNPSASQVIGADLNQHLVSSQQLDSKLGELACGSTQALMASGLLEGDQIEPIPLFLLDHSRSFNHLALLDL